MPNSGTPRLVLALLWICLVCMTALPVPTLLGTEAAATPMRVEVYLAGERRIEKVAGILTSHDASGINVTLANGSQRTLPWEALTPESAFTLKLRLIDRTDAAQWFELGKWGWERKLERQARAALAQARKLDPNLAPQIDAVLGAPSGGAVTPRTPATKPSATQSAAAPVSPARSWQHEPYRPATPEEIASEMARVTRRADAVQKELDLQLATIETDHFIIFTNWDPREYQFLRTNCEQAYTIVARQFNQNPKDNIFVGKLPVYMFNRQEDFVRFAGEIDGFAANPNVMGYFTGNQSGRGHMAMWKPLREVRGGVGGNAGLAEAERTWGRTLLHEFVHAYVNRYRTNGRIPRWLNEGIAEYISEGQLQTPGYFLNARILSGLHDRNLSILWDDEEMPTGEYYPVMMSLVKMLAEEKPRAFIDYFNDIKDGVKPEVALKKHYGVDYIQLESAWRPYAQRLK